MGQEMFDLKAGGRNPFFGEEIGAKLNDLENGHRAGPFAVNKQMWVFGFNACASGRAIRI
jgi:hypothetical protein